MKFHRPHIKFTPLILASIAKSYFQVQKNHARHQQLFLSNRLYQCRHTAFGKQYNIEDIASIDAFQQQIPIHHYDTMWPWIEQAMHGKKNIISPGHIQRFATSSGTTGVSKYIPVTKKSLRTNHFKAGEAGLMHYIKANPHSTMFVWQNITIGGSFGTNPFTGKKNVWFISAILQKSSPIRAKMMKQPKAKIAYLPDWEPKVEKIINATINKNITSIAGQPSWCSQFLLKVLEKTWAKNILEIWPHFQLVMRGWMSIELYKETFAELLPSMQVQYYQIYNASEWFFAMQHENNRDDMLLFLNHWVFYEFIPLDRYIAWDYSIAHTIHTVKIDQEYVILVTTNAWLRRYVLWDTIVFTWLSPYTIKITWRTKYYIDVAWECTPFGPIKDALFDIAKKYNIVIDEYTVWPGDIKSWIWKYEWIIATTSNTHHSNNFAKDLDKKLCELWAYYSDERHDTKMLIEPIIHFVTPTVFYKRLEKKWKLWWQHKIPKVCNDRKLIEELLEVRGQ